MHRPVMDPDHPEYSNDDPTVARAQAQVEAEIQMINERMGEDINGFVERPAKRATTRSAIIQRLIATESNGRAIPVRDRDHVNGSYVKALRDLGLRIHTHKQSDGTFVAWCERIDAASGASRPEGARP